MSIVLVIDFRLLKDYAQNVYIGAPGGKLRLAST
jgi:hypothetical protein